MTEGPSKPQPSGPIVQSGPGKSGPLNEPTSESSGPSESGQPSEPSQPSQPMGPSGAGDAAWASPLMPEGLPHTSPEASPAPPPDPNAYRVGQVVGWAVLTFLLLWPLMFLLALMVEDWFRQTTELPYPDSLRVGIRLMLAVLALGVLLPVVVSAVKFRRAANKSAASPWLGILIGSALFSLILFGAYVLPAVS